MLALVSPDKIQLPAGAVVRLPATWQEYQALSQQRGARALPRLKYRDGEVLLTAPMPQHGRDAHLIASIITTLLDWVGQEYDAFTPVTMELPEESGIEPDYCFYIDNWQAVSGKRRINWSADPPPDLVLEIDVTSYSNVNDYLPYRVPECWFLKRDRLSIHHFHPEGYVLVDQSRYFPNRHLEGVVSRALEIAYTRNTSAAVRDLKQQLK